MYGSPTRRAPLPSRRGDHHLVPLVELLGQPDHFLDRRAQVGVGEDDPLAARLGDPDLDGPALARQRRHDQPDVGSRSAAALTTSAVRSVLPFTTTSTSYGSPRASRASLMRVQRRGQARLLVIGRDDEGQQRIDHQARSRSRCQPGRGMRPELRGSGRGPASRAHERRPALTVCEYTPSCSSPVRGREPILRSTTRSLDVRRIIGVRQACQRSRSALSDPTPVHRPGSAGSSRPTASSIPRRSSWWAPRRPSRAFSPTRSRRSARRPCSAIPTTCTCGPAPIWWPSLAACTLHGLVRPDVHRQRRLSGVQPGVRARARDRQDRRDVPGRGPARSPPPARRRPSRRRSSAESTTTA